MLTLNDGRSELWQWDTGRKLTVDADCSQVHFSNKVFGRSVDVDVVDGVAIIPNILLQVDKELTAWAFVGTAENGYTKISKVFKVNKRNKPADYVFTPTEQTTLGELVERLEKIEETQDPDAIKRAVDDYLASNPIQIDEKDPTVPNWAKQASKPKYTAQEVGAVATVNRISPDESGNVQIKVPDSVEGAVLYTEQELTEEQKEQARENIGAMPADALIALGEAQVNALDALFKAASYIKDVSAEYAAFCDAFGLVSPDEPSEDVVNEIKKGTISFENGKMHLASNYAERATLIPIGRYLTKGKTYKFSLGSISNKYHYGVQILVAESADMVFPYAADTAMNYSGITERIVDTGWMTADYTYTPDTDNCILCVNFKGNPEVALNDSNYAEILENFVFEEIEPSDEDVVVQSVKKGSVSLNGSSLSLATSWDARATLIPIGQYLEKGKTYKFSLGSAAETYSFGVIVWGVTSAGLTFPYTDAGQTFSGVVTKIADDGYRTADYTFTPDRDNCIFTVSFKKGNDVPMGDSDHDTICKNFTIEEVV